MTTISLPFTTPPLTKNRVRRMHHIAEARARRDAVLAARWSIRAAKVQPMDSAIVVLHWQVPDARRRDGDGAGPTLSLCIDALVLEGVLEDDTWRHVVHSGITCHPPTPRQPGALWLTIHDPQEGT